MDELIPLFFRIMVFAFATSLHLLMVNWASITGK
jgi:hypothetical protein